jgi:hypothetical protein
MKGKLISEDAQRTFAVILNTDDEAVACLTAFAKEHRLSATARSSEPWVTLGQTDSVLY